MGKPKKRITDGNWSRDTRGLFFLPGHNPRRQGSEARPAYHLEHHNSMLVAVNEFEDKSTKARTDDALNDMTDKHVLVDSGVYWLATQHARANGLSMDQALSLPPEDLDDFDWLWDLYLEVHDLYGDKAWGFIELDQGGRENKIKTRAKLERRGITPIPVYHPLNDGWDYFDYLAERYDRIAVGNVVMADRSFRKRIIATVWHRKREKYPHLWMHLLGLHPYEVLNAYPVDSCDASTWLQGVRYGQFNVRICQKSWGGMPYDFSYPQDQANDLYEKSVRAGALAVNMQWRSWNHYHDTLDHLIGG